MSTSFYKHSKVSRVFLECDSTIYAPDETPNCIMCSSSGDVVFCKDARLFYLFQVIFNTEPFERKKHLYSQVAVKRY